MGVLRMTEPKVGQSSGQISTWKVRRREGVVFVVVVAVE